MARLPGPDCRFRRRRLAGAGPASVEVTLPVTRDGSSRPGHRLVGRMTIGRGQRGCVEELAGAVVVEPVLARFEALEHGVPCGLVVRGRVLAGRVVAATDVAAGSAATQMQPPAGRHTG